MDAAAPGRCRWSRSVGAFADESGADEHARTSGKLTPLHVSAANGREALARLLIDAGADKDAREKDERTPRHLAAQNGHEAIACLLINAGADKDARERYQSTPLHEAVTNGHDALVRLLIEAGADKDAREVLKLTPLHIAAAKDTKQWRACSSKPEPTRKRESSANGRRYTWWQPEVLRQWRGC